MKSTSTNDRILTKNKNGIASNKNEPADERFFSEVQARGRI